MLRTKIESLYRLYSIRKTLPVELLSSQLRLALNGHSVSDINLIGGHLDKHAVVTHLVRPFLLDQGSYLFKKHQSNWKAIEMVRALNTAGFSADVYSTRRDQTLDNPSKYDLLFGTNPHFFDFAGELPEHVPRIFYNAGMHWDYQNTAVQRRRSRIENRRGVRLSELRGAPEYEITAADYIVVIGDEFTRQSYLEVFPDESRIFTVPNAGFDELNVLSNGDGVTKQFPDCLTNFLWLAGSGPVLKGLDLVLEAFSELPEYDLYVCGPIDDDSEFATEYRAELYETENIHTLGWVDIFSEEFLALADRCGFHISASCSEGISGAVINTMHRGVVPITTEPVGVDTGRFGFDIEPEVASIQRTVRAASSLSETELRQRAESATEQARTRYSKQCFVDELNAALGSILETEAMH